MGKSDADFLNDLNFLGRFEALNITHAENAVPRQEEMSLCLDVAEVWQSLKRIDTSVAPGPDHIPGPVLKDCADQLACVLTDMFNTSLDQAVVPSCLKSATIIPVPETIRFLPSMATGLLH